MSSKIKNSITGLVLVFLSAFLAIFATEIALRFTNFVRFLPKESISEEYYVYDTDSIYDIAKNVATTTHVFSDGSFEVWSNDIGCFDTDFDFNQPFIYLAGDSFSWGFAPFESKWGTILEHLIDFRVLKCGVAGYGTGQELVKAERTLRQIKDPQFILLGYFLNDVTDDVGFKEYLLAYQRQKNLLNTDFHPTKDRLALWSKKYCMTSYPERPALQALKCFLSKKSIVYHFTRNTLKKNLPTSFLTSAGLANGDLGADQALSNSGKDGHDFHLENLRKFNNLSRTENTKLIVFLFPSKDEVASGKEDAFRGIVKAFFDAEKIAYVDFFLDFVKANSSGHPLYWVQDGHWNLAGNKLAGYLAARYLIRSGFISVANSEAVKSIDDVLSREFSI